MKAWTAALLAAGVVLSGCHSSIEGTPRISPLTPTEPSFPTPRPSRSMPAPSPSAPATTPGRPPADATPLPPENGYAFFQTKSGKTRCQVSRQEVGCESDFTNAPVVDGIPASGVRLSPAGQINWVVGNLGAIPAVTLDYRTYTALGWTIDAGEAGTRITNDGSGHGMTIAVEGVKTF